MDDIVKHKYDSFPKPIRVSLLSIRKTIIDTAKEDGIGEVEESLKWGEPSYSVKGGSAVRVNWKSKSPDQYYVYFHCKTKLVETFREIYPGLFTYEGNRAIVFGITEAIPLRQLKHCISMSFRYHTIKHMPLLGA